MESGTLYAASTGRTRNLTFVVTEHCNLACKYCYQVKKNTKSVMTFDVAKKAVDYMLSEFKNEPGVSWEFIGGEPFLEIDLIDKICDYIKEQMFILDHPWFNNYRINITSNGLLYDNHKVQKFIKKNHSKLNMTISLDGTEKKHDLQRVRIDGTGSYKDVVKHVPLWLKQFPNANVKVTFASEDLQYLRDSIVHLWELGIKDIPANVIYEDVWKDGDDKVYEEQIKLLADYIIEKKLPHEYTCGLIDDTIGYPLTKSHYNHNWCASGQRMLAVDYQGKFYPCVRFLSFCLEHRAPYVVGDVYEGINQDLLRPFLAADIPAQSTSECLECDVAIGCSWCQAFNYDQAETDTIYQRVTYICKMHKARCRANAYYFARLENEYGFVSKRKRWRNKYLYILLANNVTPHCNYRNTFNDDSYISYENFKKGIDYAREKLWTPILIHNDKQIPEEFKNEIKYMQVMHIHPTNHSDSYRSSIAVYDNTISKNIGTANSILLVNKDNISLIPKMLQEMLSSGKRVNIVLEDTLDFNDKNINEYSNALSAASELIYEYLSQNIVKEVNVLTDIMMLGEMQNCNAGVQSLTLGVDGEIYLCPAFYYSNDKGTINGDYINGFKIKNGDLFKLSKSPVCSKCDVFHCKRCVYQNKTGTREFSIPTSIQCKISHLERSKSLELQQKILKLGINTPFIHNKISEIDYDDPMSIILEQKKIK